MTLSFFSRRSKRNANSIDSASVSSTRTSNNPSANVTESNLHQRHDPRIQESALDVEADSIPQTDKEAREHIAQIREQKGLHGTDSNTSDLEAALKVLSEQLYQKSTHFLLELIQNADDNSYNVSTPTLDITYDELRLRIDCNEVGFSKRNVAAICRIGQSSKTRLDNTRRYIGEKGIGFKSVFRVSDVVWIQSGYYSFKFDKAERLGMIAPIWTKFPGTLRPGFTSILLQLSKKCNIKELVQDVMSLDPRLLIFLQKLKRVNITIEESGKFPRKTSLERQDLLDDKTGHGQFITLRHRTIPLSYRTFRVHVRELPPEPNRPDHTESEILLAFPLEEDGTPRIQSQNVYAFLPIRDYGFKFLLQADFVLIASREDIDSSSQWNKALLEMIPKAFHGAIQEFNRGPFRYSWLPYLPSRGTVADFFKRLEENVLKILSKSPILESFAGVLTPPRELIYVPERLCDESGTPLILTPETRSSYVSNKYPSSDRYRLMQLGVTPLSVEDFIKDLGKFILEYPEDFQGMPESWHSRLAEVLASSIMSSKDYQNAVSNLQIVPLRDGRWVAPREENLLFPSRSKPLIIPNGIDVVEIHPEAEADYYRRQLFMILGAKDFRAEQICEIIIKTQEKESFRPENLSRKGLISHVEFLFKSGWKNGNERDLWFVSETNGYCHGSEAYINSDLPYSAKLLFAEAREKFPFLHPDYYEAFPEKGANPEAKLDGENAETWEKWLVNHMNVAQIPRLATPSLRPPFLLSPDFNFLVKKYPSSEILLLLRYHWKYYSKWIVTRETQKLKEAWDLSQRQLKSKISSLEVKCRRGLVHPLHQTFLPVSSLQLESFVSVPLLDVPEPDHDDWDYLKHFGVVVELDANFLVECLRRLKSTGTTRKQVSQLYGHIAMWITPDNAGVIRHSFQMHKLVFVPDENSESGEWFDIDGCVWTGPECLRATPCLERFYREHQHFFQNDLNVGDASIKTLVNEAQQIIPSDSIEHIGQILMATSKYLELSSSDTSIQALVEAAIFPIASSKVGLDFASLSSATPVDIWFIADLTHLKASFEGLVPLLALGPEIVESIGPLIKALGLDERLLSRVAKGVSKTSGKVQLHPVYTETMREKARSIARLVPKESPNRNNSLKQLRNIEVYESERVIIEWVITSANGVTNYGRAEAGRVTSQSDSQKLKVFLTKDDLDVSLPPLDLQEELAKVCEIKDKKHFTLLLYILMQKDPKSIEDTLERRGISNDVPEFDEKKVDEPWESSDASKLLSKICKYEALDPSMLLPRKIKQSDAADDPVASLFDSKTGAWKEAIFDSKALQRSNTQNFESLSLPKNEEVDEEIQHVAELSVSQFLGTNLGKEYSASKHWTSILRSQSGYGPYEGRLPGCSTFTLTNKSGSFAKLLVRLGHNAAGSWVGSTTYHIQVVASKKGLISSFTLHPLQVKKAREFSLRSSGRETPSDVFILVIVHSILSEPTMAMFVDPWETHVQGGLEFLALTPYYASFHDSASPIILPSIDKPDHLPSAENKGTRHSDLYTYQPLRNHGEIRLIELAPGEGDMPLEGTIHHVSLDDAGEFYALSYAWGAAVKPFYFSTRSGKIPITLSLHSAFKTIRDPVNPTRIWADIICIDQDTHLEKRIQIRLLRRIYQTADIVIAWLGGGNDSSDRAITTLLQMKAATMNLETWPDTLPPIPLSWGGKNLPSSLDPVWKDIEKLLSRDWFKRSWIVQELILGSNVSVLCGEWSLPWEDFFSAIKTCRSALESESSSAIHTGLSINCTDAAYALGLTRESRLLLSDHIFGHKYRLLELLELFAYTEATLERDKIFSLLGLSLDCKGPAFDPDYESNFETVIRRYATEFIRQGYTMSLLSRAGLSKSYPFSTWLPAWTRQRFPSTLSTWRSTRGAFHAGGTQSSRAQVLESDARLLKVSGKSFDTIVRMSDKRPDEQDIISIVTHIQTSLATLSSYPTGEPPRSLSLTLPIASAKTPVREPVLSLPQLSFTTHSNLQDWPDDLEAKIPKVDLMHDFLAFCKRPKDQRPVGWQYWETAAALLNRLGNGTLCFTRKGYVGLVPGAAEVGDEICILYGGATPFILREDRGSTGTYSLVGEAYIHGIMHGEALAQRNVPRRDFVLR
ncbi:hypothetical protein CC78DRAFT_452837 [Lojkania enalia]|uniref:Heterokaryon incompatibility domain-containing protein n=1 Tax=Lojkania enalia TaxID=147567 RepID=A0A9P4NAN7_9PLEO|nr:hypothetical protein CC78DRAFT_452837 [Didymosphaeria enalia]